MDIVGQVNTALAGRYQISHAIGEGGMATVFRAADLRHGRDVAIKILRAEFAASLGAERFLAEIRTTARLSHPHILPLHDSGEAGGFLFYVMPLVEGESLRERLTREKRLSLDEAVRLAREVGDALGYAHSHNVIHRDIKPENILLQSGHALVADFGIARARLAAGAERITTAGMAVGTPAYMSPEQAAGETDIDARSDLYSLASVLYEMIAGEPPFTGPTADAILVQRFTQPAPRVTQKRAGVPRPVVGAIAVAMSRAPEDRFPTVERFIAALAGDAAEDEDAGEQSIAVLPFANMSGDIENEYFSDGISEEIINALTQLPGLRVAARTSAFSFKGKNIDLRSIGDQLGVRTVLEGSVRKAGNRLRITAQLINVADGYHLWSERYDRDATDVFAIQDEIAHAIAAKLELSMGERAGKQLVARATENLDAYELFLKGRALELERGPALLTAVECFEQAIALDPRYAAAHAELAKSLLLLSMWGLSHPKDTHTRAAAATARALEFGTNNVSTWTAQALFSLVVEHDRECASDAWARAVALDAADVEARALRAVYDLAYVRAECSAALRELQTAVDADPLNVNTRAHRSLVYSWALQFADAEAEARRALEMGPRVFYAHWALVHGLMLGPTPAAGVVAATQMLARFGRHPWPLMGLALASGRSGQRDIAEAVYDELHARSRSTYVQPAVLGVAAIGAGNHAAAIDHLADAVRIRDPLVALFGHHWPGLSPLRGTPEFGRVLALAGWERPFAGKPLERNSQGST